MHGMCGGRARVSKRDDYRARLRATPRDAWAALLRAESGLPGPRANLELMQAAADEGALEQFRAWARRNDECLAACGALGLGRLIADGDEELVAELRALASDARWRVREGVAMGLQRVGLASMARLLELVEPWQAGGWLEQRAVVAALCEPALVREEAQARAVLAVLDRVMTNFVSASDRKDDFRVLRQALAYGWSVAIVGAPEVGKPRLEHWLRCGDPDAEWIMRENLKKNRLAKMDASWVASLR
jgi:hypothetical protein